MRRSRNLTGSEIDLIAADSNQRLWIKYLDGSWIWADLAAFIESTPEPDLSPYCFFLTARLDWNRETVNWIDGRSISVQAFHSAEHTLARQGIYILSRSIPEGWYRPLMVRGLVDADIANYPPERPLEALMLLLRITVPTVQEMVSIYKVESGELYTRVLDLAIVMSRTGHPEEMLTLGLGWRLHEPWEFGRHMGRPEWITPALAITYGWLALVEQLYGSDLSARRT